MDVNHGFLGLFFPSTVIPESSSPAHPHSVLVSPSSSHDCNLGEERHDNLDVYRACAEEFHETGIVKNSCHGLDCTKFSVHITFILVAIVMCASVATGVTPLTILSVRLTNEIDDLATKLALQVTEAVVEQLQQLTKPCPSLCDAVHRMFRSGLLSSHLEGGLESVEAQALFTYLWEMLDTVKGDGIPILYVGTEYSAEFTYELWESGYVMWNRTSPFKLATTPGGPVLLTNSSSTPDSTAWWSPRPGQINTTNGLMDFVCTYDPRQRPWYAVAKAGGPDYKGWSEPYVFYDGVTLGFTAVQSLRNSTGHFIGVVGSDITLQGLVDYLTSDKMRLSPNMRHTVIETSGLIIGSSVLGVVSVQRSATGENIRLNVLDAQQPQELRAVVRALQSQGEGGIGSINTEGKLVTLEGNYVYATPLRDEYNMSWIYIMYVPTNDFLRHAVATTTLCIGICAGVIVIITLAALFAALDLSARLSTLAADMRRATSLTLNSIRTHKNSSHIREVQAISVEFCKLVNALRSFQKYLPQAQVGFLLSSNLEANLAAIQHQVTVMFLDIENFTELVETLSDSLLISFYGEIMTLLTDKVLEAQGTLDKYIGDAIMAFWNMPRSVAKHEQRAVEAALACRNVLPRLCQKGWDLEFRIGINTGICQVGNFGSQDRLNYTVIGDNVNVASRLETLCKTYHARVLIAGTTHAGLDTDLFLTRLVDKVSVKGKAGETIIHQVMGWRQDATGDTLQNCVDYEDAFQHYIDGDYDLAQETWEKAAAHGDATAQMMADRVLEGPPESGGLWRWQSK